MTQTSIISPPHSSHMNISLQTLYFTLWQTLFKPPRNNSFLSLFHVNSFEILKYVTKAKQKRKRKRQGKKEGEKERKKREIKEVKRRGIS